MPTSAKTKFMELLGSMKMAIEVRPVGPNTMRLTPARPQTIPPAQPPIMDAIKGFFRRRFTPYRAGSVVPRRALQPVEIARDLKPLSLACAATAKAAAPCAMFATRKPGPSIS